MLQPHDIGREDLEGEAPDRADPKGPADLEADRLFEAGRPPVPALVQGRYPDHDVRPVPLGHLRIDPEVQRTRLDEERVEKLANHWQPVKAGTLVVSVRSNGEMIVLDGWHRLSAMRELEARGQPTHSAWCELLFGLTPAQEAEVFLGRNDALSVHIIDKFKNRCRAGEPTAIAIRDILRKYGSRVDFASEAGYACVATLERAFLHGVLEGTVHLIEECWGRTEPRSAHSAPVVEAVCLFLRNYGTHRWYLSDRALVKFGAPEAAGRRHTPLADVVKQARAMASVTHDPIYVELARILRTRYNHQAKNRLPDVEVLSR